jgi:hypothetical protein
MGDRELADLLSRAAEFVKSHPKFGHCRTEHDPGFGTVLVDELREEARQRYTAAHNRESGHAGELPERTPSLEPAPASMRIGPHD